MNSAFELALKRAESFRDCPVPVMDHPMGKYWEQPDPETFIFDADIVVMIQEAFDSLLDYSHSAPTGCYPGKMWKSNNSGNQWYLCWYGVSEKGPDWCSTQVRKILIV